MTPIRVPELAIAYALMAVPNLQELCDYRRCLKFAHDLRQLTPATRRDKVANLISYTKDTKMATNASEDGTAPIGEIFHDQGFRKRASGRAAAAIVPARLCLSAPWPAANKRPGVRSRPTNLERYPPTARMKLGQPSSDKCCRIR